MRVLFPIGLRRISLQPLCELSCQDELADIDIAGPEPGLAIAEIILPHSPEALIEALFEQELNHALPRR